ncbi:multidrug effflux MFS transporter [Demequina aurantiaca]|uniref:multidrug effflux MFS transporter n=1 Tax=Demequina aurantiaca TaxID=676200 RepID=UPI000AB4DC64|nr:multidrug effflux MFS transporter [Demequina aurantiaca]
MTSDLATRPAPDANETTAAEATSPPLPPTRQLGETLSRSGRIGYILMLGALVALGPFTIDLYLPAFPEVAADLNASDAAIQFTLTATMIGFGLGQLIVGPLSDSFGRKKPLIIATTLHVVASIAVALAPTVEWVMVGRVFQGIGAAGGAVVAMAVVRDLFAGQSLIRMLSRMALVTGLAPVLAPVIGSQLLRVVDWREVFYVLAAYGILIGLIVTTRLVETLPKERRGTSEPGIVRKRYRKLLTDPAFVGVAIVGAMTFTTLFAYLSSSSFVLQDIYGLSAQQYGIVFGVNSAGIMICTQVASRLMRRFPPRAVIALGLSVMMTGALALLIGSAFDLGLLGVMVPLFFVVASVGLIGPAVQVTALANHGQEAGTAASLIGAANFGIAGLISPLVGILGISVLSMGIVMVGALLVAHATYWFVVRPRVQTTVVA